MWVALRVQLEPHGPEPVHHQVSSIGEKPSRRQRRARRVAARNATVEEAGKVFEKESAIKVAEYAIDETVAEDVIDETVAEKAKPVVATLNCEIKHNSTLRLMETAKLLKQ